MTSEVKISKRLALINAASTGATRTLRMGALLWMQYYLLRRISPEEFSIYPLAGIFLLFLSIINSIFSAPSFRFITMAYAKGDRNAVTEIISTIMPIVTGAGFLLLLLGITAAYFADSLFLIKPDYLADAQLVIGLFVISGTITLILEPLSAGFFTLQRAVTENLIHLTGEVIKICLLITLLLGVSPRVLWVAVAHFVTVITVSFLRATVSYRLLPEIKFNPKAIRWEYAGELLRFGFAAFTIMASKFLRNSTALWVLNRFATPVDVTSYHLGQTAYRQTLQIWLPIRGNIGPPLIAMVAKGQDSRIRQAYYRGGRIALWLILFVTTPLVIFRAEVINLYTGGIYSDAAIIMALLLLRYPVELINAMLPQVARAKGKVGTLAIVALTTQVVNICAILTVIWGLGYSAIAAAVCALTVTVISEIFLLWPLALRMVDGSVLGSLRKTFIPGVTPALTAAFAWHAIPLTVNPDSWTSLIMAIAPGCAVYLLVGWACLKTEDRQDFRKLLKIIRRS